MEWGRDGKRKVGSSGTKPKTDSQGAAQKASNSRRQNHNAPKKIDWNDGGIGLLAEVGDCCSTNRH